MISSSVASYGGSAKTKWYWPPAGGPLASVAPTLAAPPPDGRPYQVVFADPPYDTTEDEVAAVLHALVDHGWLGEGGTVVIERSSRTPAPAWVPGITAERSRRYGETVLWYGRVS